MATGSHLLRTPLTAVGVLASQVYWAAQRSDLPSFVDQDPSGDFGDRSLPVLRIVVLGDSSVTAPGIDIDECWARRTAFHLSHRYMVELRSVAVGGSKARDLLAIQVPTAVAIGGTIALLSIGANDALRGTPLPRFEAELEEAVGMLRPHFPMIGIAGVGDLGTMPRLPSLAQTIARTRARSVDGAIRRVIDGYPGVVKGTSWGRGWTPFDTNPEIMFSGDLFHASGAGHELFGNAAIAVVDTLLDAEASAPVTGSRGSLESAT